MPSTNTRIMPQKKYVTVVFLLFALTAIAQQPVNKNVGIIPAPASVIVKEGGLNLRNITAIFSKGDNNDEADLLHVFLLDNFKLDIPVINKSERITKNTITFSPD